MGRDRRPRERHRTTQPFVHGNVIGLENLRRLIRDEVKAALGQNTQRETQLARAAW